MLEEAAGVEGRELSLGERQAQLEKYRFRFVNIYQELEMSSRFVDTHRDVSQGGDGVQLHSHTFYEMIYCTGGSTQYLLGTQRYRLRHGDIVLIPPGVSHRPLLAEKMADPYRRCVVWFSQEYVESVRPMWPELLKNQRFGVLRTANTRWEGMAKLFEAGCGEAARGAPGWQAVVCATTLELLVNIARALEDVDRPTPPAEVPDLFDRLNLFIEEHLAQDVTLERAAREFFVSKSTIDQLFRKSWASAFTGISRRAVSSRRRSAFWKERPWEGSARMWASQTIPRFTGRSGGNTASPRLISATLTARDAAQTAGTALLCAMEKRRPGWPRRQRPATKPPASEVRETKRFVLRRCLLVSLTSLFCAVEAFARPAHVRAGKRVFSLFPVLPCPRGHGGCMASVQRRAAVARA